MTDTQAIMSHFILIAVAVHEVTGEISLNTVTSGDTLTRNLVLLFVQLPLDASITCGPAIIQLLLPGIQDVKQPGDGSAVGGAMETKEPSRV